MQAGCVFLIDCFLEQLGLQENERVSSVLTYYQRLGQGHVFVTSDESTSTHY